MSKCTSHLASTTPPEHSLHPIQPDRLAIMGQPVLESEFAVPIVRCASATSRRRDAITSWKVPAIRRRVSLLNDYRVPPPAPKCDVSAQSGLNIDNARPLL